jgi:hypothetical protein
MDDKKKDYMFKDFLLWNRCIFLTHEQYKNGEHLNDNIYYYRSITTNVQEFVTNHIKELSSKLPFKSVPKPIYVLIAKHIELDKDKQVFDLECKKAYNYAYENKFDYNFIKEKYNKDYHLNDLPYKDTPIQCISAYSDIMKNRLDYSLYLNEVMQPNTPNTNKFQDHQDLVTPVQCKKAYTDLIEKHIDYDEYKKNPSSDKYRLYDKTCFQDANNNYIPINHENIRSFQSVYETNKKLQIIRDSNYPTTCFLKPDIVIPKSIDDYLSLQHETLRKFREIYNKNEKLKHFRNNYKISCFVDPDNEKGELMEFDGESMKKHSFIYNMIGNDQEKLLKTSLSPFTFKDKYEVIIYVPNLNKNLKYFTSFQDFSFQNRWMNIIANDKSKYMSILHFIKDFANAIKEEYGEDYYEKNKSRLEPIFKFVNEYFTHEYPLSKDLYHICFDLGCSTEYGEDLQEMVPSYDKDFEKQVNNAKAKAPYYPTKCLRTKYYEDHMIKLKDSYKKDLLKILMEDIKQFESNYKNFESGKPPSGQSSTNIIDTVKGSFARYRNKEYDSGTYSEKYNRMILTELALRIDNYPGIQEIVFPVFRLNDKYSVLDNFTHYMPWGNILLTNEYVLNEGDKLNIETTPLYSFNKVYSLKIHEKTGYLAVFKNDVFDVNHVLINEDFRKYSKKSIILQNGSLSIYGYEGQNNDNRYSISISTSKGIWPLSLILENDGQIQVYDNGFNIINKLKYIEFSPEEKLLISRNLL